jgi:selenocysteine lyase/cysteine desulfurase
VADTPLPRDEFPVAKQYCYLDHAGVSPLPRAAARVITEITTGVLGEGRVAYDEYADRIDRARASAAGLLGARPEDVAFVKNTTEGLGHVAAGLELQPGERVVLPDREFPSTILPWLALEQRGVRVDRISPIGPTGALTLDSFGEALALGRTRIVVCSWVQFQTGWRTDLEALANLCHDSGALLCVDLIQGLGVIPSDMAAWGVDFAVAGSHKWMLGPMGAGVLYVAADRLDEVRMHHPGWNSVAHREEWDNLDLVLDDTARRFEGGTLDLAAIAGLGASIDLLESTGVDKVWAHVEDLCRTAALGLTDAGATILSDRSVDCRSGILTFAVPGHEAEDVVDHLADNAIVCAARGGGVRVSPHGYNSSAEIERLIDCVASLTPAEEPEEPLDPPEQGPMRRPTDW